MTVVAFTVHSWCDRASVHLHFHWAPCWGLSLVANFSFSFRTESSCSTPWVQGKLAGWARQVQGPQGEVQVDGHSLDPRENRSYDNCNRFIVRLADWLISWRLPSLVALAYSLGKKRQLCAATNIFPDLRSSHDVLYTCTSLYIL